MKFIIELTAKAIYYEDCTVEVEAGSKKEAEALIKKKIKSGEINSEDWSIFSGEGLKNITIESINRRI